jgi:hypothetical protein
MMPAETAHIPPLDAFEPTFRTALGTFMHIGRQKATDKAAQGGEASADAPR